jgi:hypothetical protein
MNDAYKIGYSRIKWRPLPPPPEKPQQRRARADLPCPMVISDTMDAVEHVDGKFYESKSAYRAVTKARGYIEVGNDPARLRPPERAKPNEKDQIDAIDRALTKVMGA